MEEMDDGASSTGRDAEAANSTHNEDNHHWCFAQVKGSQDEEIQDADVISCVEFDESGELLATGDKGGRVVIFRREKVRDAETGRPRCEYSVYSTFQSHEPEFDYLKSLEIEEKINKIKWLPKSNSRCSFLLSTNDKTVKLWRLLERDKRADGFNLRSTDGVDQQSNGTVIGGQPPSAAGDRSPSTGSLKRLRVPRYVSTDLVVEASPRRVFANAHTYHINSISVNSDQATFLSADDLRVNLWHLECTSQSFNVVDIKPANMEDLTEVITAAEFHPNRCAVFIYSSSKGTIRLCDMRQQALCDRHAKLFEEPEDPSNRSFFSEIITSISDVKFSHSGKYILSRDYLTLKVWDVAMEARPVETYSVHEYFRSKLCTLYENDCIFDKFECAWSGDDQQLLTGSYNNFFRLVDRRSQSDLTFEANRDHAMYGAPLNSKRIAPTGRRARPGELAVDNLNFNKKILHIAWHPRDDVVAIAATNNLYTFCCRCPIGAPCASTCLSSPGNVAAGNAVPMDTH